MDLKRKYGLTFLGHKQVRSPRRIKAITKVLETQKLTLFGKNLCRKFKQHEREIITQKQTNKMFNQSKVCINFPFYDSTQECLRILNAPNDRFFEIPGSGGIQLTAWSKYLETYYEPDKECFYYKNDEEMVDKASWLVKNSDKLNKVRHAALKRSLSEHTYRNRMKTIIKTVKERL